MRKIVFLLLIITIIYILCFIFGRGYFLSSNSNVAGISTIIFLIIGTGIVFLCTQDDGINKKVFDVSVLWYSICIGFIVILSVIKVLSFTPLELIKIEYAGYEKKYYYGEYITYVELDVYNLNEDKKFFGLEYNDFEFKEIIGEIKFYDDDKLIYQENVQIRGESILEISEDTPILFNYDINELKITFKILEIEYLDGYEKYDKVSTEMEISK